jgi:hypothetical protein
MADDIGQVNRGAAETGAASEEVLNSAKTYATSRRESNLWPISARPIRQLHYLVSARHRRPALPNQPEVRHNKRMGNALYPCWEFKSGHHLRRGSSHGVRYANRR